MSKPKKPPTKPARPAKKRGTRPGGEGLFLVPKMPTPRVESEVIADFAREPEPPPASRLRKERKGDRLTVHIDHDLDRMIRGLATREHRSMSDIVSEAVGDYLAEKRKKSPALDHYFEALLAMDEVEVVE